MLKANQDADVAISEQENAKYQQELEECQTSLDECTQNIPEYEKLVGEHQNQLETSVGVGKIACGG